MLTSIDEKFIFNCLLSASTYFDFVSLILLRDTYSECCEPFSFSR